MSNEGRCANSELLAKEEEKWASEEAIHEAFISEVEANGILDDYEDVKTAFEVIRDRYDYNEPFDMFINKNY